MPTPIVFEDVAPVVPVRNLQAALERYRQLGFEVRAYGHGTGYGFAQRGAVSIHLSEWDEHDPKAHRRGHSVSWIRMAPCTEWVRSCLKDPTGDGRTCRQSQRTPGIRE